MSWSFQASSADKAALRKQVELLEHCPHQVKEALNHLIQGQPNGVQISIQSDGHCDEGESGVFGGKIKFSAVIPGTEPAETEAAPETPVAESVEEPVTTSEESGETPAAEGTV